MIVIYIFFSGIAKWSDISEFYKLDNNANFVFAPALTDRHINPNLREQMRVKLAAQILSHSVTAGILTYVAQSKYHVFMFPYIHTFHFIHSCLLFHAFTYSCYSFKVVGKI